MEERERAMRCAAVLAASTCAALALVAATAIHPAEAEGTVRAEFADEPMEAAFEPPRAEQEHAENKPSDAEAVPGASFEGWTEEYAAAEEATPYSAPEPFGVNGDPDGLNSFVGVVEWNGRTETAYSSNVLYHYRTSEWTPDEFGFYRTDDGLYVVGSDDYEMGSVIETSRGPALVADCGGDPGITDFYTNW